MRITVIVCTYNRCQSLPEALNSIADQVMPPSLDWEVLVVNNNSTDQTPEVVAQFCEKYPGRFRYLFEPRPGLSWARNSGIRDARGDIVVFTDDDVRVAPNWLETLTKPLLSGDCVGSGGRVLPDWPCAPPRWLPGDRQYAIVMFDLGDQPGQLKEPPLGANMAYRKEVFERYGEFRTDLGHIGNQLMGHEESEFGVRLLGAGKRLLYEPGAVVYHPVTKERLQKRYFLRYSFDAGRGAVRQGGILPESRFYFLNIPLYLFRRLSVWTLRWLIALRPDRRLSYKLKVWGICGQIAEHYSQSLDPVRHVKLGHM